MGIRVGAIVGLACAMTLVGCRDGGGGDDAADSSGTADDGGDGDDGSSASCDGEISPAPMRRLTSAEYNNTVRDLLGDDTNPADAFPNEASAIGFSNQVNKQGVSPVLAEQYLQAAEGIAARAVADLAALLPCDPATDGEDSCGQLFIAQFGSRAYRRPVTAEEGQRLTALFDATRSAYHFDKAIELVLQAMLQSPNFLYRVEFGMPDTEQDGATRLGHYEVASRLSYLLWGTMPDEELFAAAEAEELRTAEELETQARRMLQDDRARWAVDNFHRQWLRVDEVDLLNKDAAEYPSFDDGLKADLKAETLKFLDHLVFDGAGDLATMFVADYTFANTALAAHYGLADAPQGAGLERVDLDPTQRAGILTHGSILAATGKPAGSSPVLRGVFVRERLLCDELPEPPPDVDTNPPNVDPTATTRERFEQHRTDPTCATCHNLIDTLGNGFEHYDGIGRWRDEENGKPIDASGSVVGVVGGDIEFDGAVELAQILADSQDVRECVVEQWFTYAHGRRPEQADGCATDEITAAFEASGQDIQELLVALTQTEAFRYRPAI